MAHPIRPESYISMDNFYTSTVYSKGAEIVGIYKTLLGTAAAYVYTHTYTHIHTYIHTHKYTYTHTYIPTHIHKYIPTYLHTYIHTYIHTNHRGD